MDSFVVYALVAGMGVALFMGPLGVFVVWRRMAYFGDSVAHSALLGVTLGVVLDIDLTAGTVVVCLTMALMLVFLRQRRDLAEDTLLGILAHSSFALGLVTTSFVATLRVDLMGYLFGFSSLGQLFIHNVHGITYNCMTVTAMTLCDYYRGHFSSLCILWPRKWTSVYDKRTLQWK